MHLTYGARRVALFCAVQEWNESFGPDAPLLRDAASLGVQLSASDGAAGAEEGGGAQKQASHPSFVSLCVSLCVS